ncbi:MAG: hypothetical protein QXO27_04545, partial [Candidatus Aenigmatarchaeota archaeon]
KPISVSNNNEWGTQWSYLQNLNIFGTNYDVILANHSNVQNPICSSQATDQCVNSLWIVPSISRNFSLAENLVVGENFTKDLYLVSVGPNDGNGIIIGNFSLLPNLEEMKGPAFGGFPVADNTPTYLGILNETELNYDLNKDSELNETFYVILFDGDFNYQQSVTNNLVDDDLELMPWIMKIGDEDVAIDYTRGETGMNENWGELPRGVWTGSIRFGNENNNKNVKWEYQPYWDIPFVNNTHLLLKKQKWVVDENKPVDIVLKVYDFDQTPISGANISITKISRASPMGFQTFSDYQVNTMYNVTNLDGFAILKITPNSGWLAGQYQVIVSIQASQGTESVERWFCVGNCGW